MGMTPSADIRRKCPIPSAAEEDVQQALAILWVRAETGLVTHAEADALLVAEVHPGMLDALIQQGFVLKQKEQVSFSPEGKAIARDVVRRHRLAERLLQDVLTLPADQIDSNACRLEHVITADVEGAICTLLGHPEACPHGAVIPRGTCCEEAVQETGPIVVPLKDLESGENAQIVYLSPGNRPELHKFLSMGLVPGTSLHVDQTFPALVLSVNGTILALDGTLAQHIFVRKKR
jgi:DtxR family transcriptional regulator, Mn-dependent transcriptional regulator